MGLIPFTCPNTDKKAGVALPWALPLPSASPLNACSAPQDITFTDRQLFQQVGQRDVSAARCPHAARLCWPRSLVLPFPPSQAQPSAHCVLASSRASGLSAGSGFPEGSKGHSAKGRWARTSQRGSDSPQTMAVCGAEWNPARLSPCFSSRARLCPLLCWASVRGEVMALRDQRGLWAPSFYHQCWATSWPEPRPP